MNEMKRRLNQLACAINNCPEALYSLDHFSRIFLDEKDFAEAFAGEDINIRANENKALRKIYAYAYIAYFEMGGVEFFTYLTEDQLDEDARKALHE